MADRPIIFSAPMVRALIDNHGKEVDVPLAIGANHNLVCRVAVDTLNVDALSEQDTVCRLRLWGASGGAGMRYMPVTRWCGKCQAHVPQMHQHHGLADYYIPALGAAFHCTWCRKPVANNDVLCKCPGAKKSRGER